MSVVNISNSRPYFDVLALSSLLATTELWHCELLSFTLQMLSGEVSVAQRPRQLTKKKELILNFCCSFANTSVGLQEKVVMTAFIQQCQENGTDLPDDPAIRAVAEQLQQEQKVEMNWVYQHQHPAEGWPSELKSFMQQLFWFPFWFPRVISTKSLQVCHLLAWQACHICSGFDLKTEWEFLWDTYSGKRECSSENGFWALEMPLTCTMTFLQAFRSSRWGAQGCNKIKEWNNLKPDPLFGLLKEHTSAFEGWEAVILALTAITLPARACTWISPASCRKLRLDFCWSSIISW